jgi:hypothetical protein
LCARVGCREFGCKVGEVGECELARVGFIADTEEADGVLDNVAATKKVNWVLATRLVCCADCRVY